MQQPTTTPTPVAPKASKPSPFARAVKTQARARIAIAGGAGHGKTYSALRIATGLAGEGGTIALIDTEAGSASKYADEFAFDTLSLDSFHPQRYIDAIKAAETAGYTVIVIDSLSHAWKGKDGVMDQVDRAKQGGNEFAAWMEPSKLHQRLVDTIVQSKAHIIATMRSRMEYVMEAQERGGRTVQVPRQVGLAPIQRDEMPYEFDLYGSMDAGHSYNVTKSRIKDLQDAHIEWPDETLGERLRAWLGQGAPVQEPTTLTDAHLRAYAEASRKVPQERRDLFYSRWLPSYGITGSREEKWGQFRAIGRHIADAGLEWLRGESEAYGPNDPAPLAASEEPATAPDGTGDSSSPEVSL